MTTSVTDDRQAAFESWYAAHYKTAKPIRRSPEGMKSHCPDLHYNSFQENMAYEAWQAALRSRGKVVFVDALQGLCDEWENMKVPRSANSYELGMFDGYRGARRDLTAIIGEGD